MRVTKHVKEVVVTHVPQVMHLEYVDFQDAPQHDAGGQTMDTAGKRRALLVGGVALYAIGAGSLGGIVGLLTGMSQTSVVSTVMGAVFALLGAAGSFYLPWTQVLPTTTRQTAADAAAFDVIPKVAEKKAALTVATEVTKAAASAQAVAENAAAEAQHKVNTLAGDATDEQRSAAQTALTAAEDARAVTTQAIVAAKLAQNEATKAAEEAVVLLSETVNEADVADSKARDLATDGFAKTYLVSGSALLLFSLGFGFALLYGVLLRTGTSWGDLAPQAPVIELATDADAATLADAVLLDRIFAALGVRPLARQAITSQLHTSCAREVGREEIAIKSAYDAISVARDALHEIVGDTRALQKLANASDLNAERDLVKSALLQATELTQVPDNTTSNPTAVRALNTFIATSVDFLYCSGSDTVVAKLLANLAKLGESPLKDALFHAVAVESRPIP